MLRSIPLVLLGCFSGICLLVACADGDQGAASAPAVLASTAARPLLLVPEDPRATVGRPFRLTFRNGALDGGPVTDLLDAFDPCALRVGGHQQNVLEPDVVDGAAGLTVVLPEDGNAMVGFSTAPRRVVWRGEDVAVSHHGKSLFIGARTVTGVPESSAALSYRFGLRLEIVPMVDPLPLLPGEQLPLQVRFDGPELGGAELSFRWWPRDQAGEPREVFHGSTDLAGAVVVPVQKAGRYVAVVEHRHDGEVLVASLTFRIGEK